MFNIMARAAVFIWALSALVSPAGASGTAFFVIDEVYPFTPPQQLLEEIDALLEEQGNVCIAVMPIYQNTDYPAFAEFAEVLQYAENRGCRILIHSPLIQKADPAVGEIAALIQANMEIYEDMSVHPRGVLFDADSGFPGLEEELELYFPVFTLHKEDEISLVRNWTAYPVLDTQRLPMIQYTYEEIHVDEQYDYHRNVMDDISVSLEGSNRVLLVIVCAAILIFSGMMIYARRLNYKQFIGSRNTKRDPGGEAEKHERD